MIRYQLALLAHSQRYLPPMLAFLALLGIAYTDHGAAPGPEFAVGAGGLTVVACWLTIALVDAEDPVQRLITLAHARRPAALLRGVVLALLVCGVLLTAASLLWWWIRHQGQALDDLGVGALAHLACLCTGIAIGLPCSRLLVPRIGYTVLAALAALVVVVLVRWIPLINPMLRAMSAGAAATVPALVGLVVSAVVLAVSATIVEAVYRRRS